MRSLIVALATLAMLFAGNAWGQCAGCGSYPSGYGTGDCNYAYSLWTGYCNDAAAHSSCGFAGRGYSSGHGCGSLAGLFSGRLMGHLQGLANRAHGFHLGGGCGAGCGNSYGGDCGCGGGAGWWYGDNSACCNTGPGIMARLRDHMHQGCNSCQPQCGPQPSCGCSSSCGGGCHSGCGSCRGGHLRGLMARISGLFESARCHMSNRCWVGGGPLDCCGLTPAYSLPAPQYGGCTDFAVPEVFAEPVSTGCGCEGAPVVGDEVEPAATEESDVMSESDH